MQISGWKEFSLIEYRNVEMKFGSQVILEKLNLQIKDHELFVLVGPSRSGKTTLIRIINQLTIPMTGQVYSDNQPVSEINLSGYVLQPSSLFSNLTVGKNIVIQLE